MAADVGVERTTTTRTRRRAVYEFLSRKRVMTLLTIVPALALFTAITLVPILWAITASFYQISPFSPEWQWVGLGNYAEIVTDPAFWKVLERSLVFAAGSVLLQLVTGTALALLINRSFKFAPIVRAIAMLPYLIPTAVLGFVALWMGNSQWGIINQVLVQIGLIDSYIPWYGSQDLAMISLIVTNSWKFSIFVTIMVLARLQGIPRDFYEAAEVAGASSWQTFRDITLPNLKGVIFIVLLLRGVWMFNKFDIIWVLTKGGPLGKTTTAPIYAYKIGFSSALLGKAAAVSTLLFVMLVVAAVIYFRVLDPSKEVRTRVDRNPTIYNDEIPGWNTLSFATRERISRYAKHALMVAGLVVIVFPIFWMISTAIRPDEQYFTQNAPLIPSSVTLEQFEYILFETNLARYYVNSIVVAIGVVVLNTTIATLGGYGLTRLEIPYKESFARLILFGYMFPAILLAIPMFIFWKQIGIINSYLGLILAEVAVALPFSLWMMWKFFQTVPISLEESARIAGATRFEAFYEIALPMAKPGMTAIAVFSYAMSWNAYTIPKIIMPDEQKWVLTVGIDTLVQGFSVNWGGVMAASTLIILPSLLLIFTLQKYLLEGFKAGGA